MAYYFDVIDEYGANSGLTYSDSPWDVGSIPDSQYTYAPNGNWRKYGSKIEVLENGKWTPFNSGVNSRTGLDALWASVSTPKEYYDLIGKQLGSAGMFDMSDSDASEGRVALLRGLTVVAPNTSNLYGPTNTMTPGANADALARAHFTPEQLMAMNSVALQDASGKTVSNFVPSRLFGNVMYGNDNANETWGAPPGIQADLDAYGIRGEMPGLGTGYYIDPTKISGFRANEVSRKYQTQEDSGMFGLGDLEPMLLAAAGLYFGMPYLTETLGGALGGVGAEAAAVGGSEAGLSWLGNQGLATIPEAVSALPSLPSAGMITDIATSLPTSPFNSVSGTSGADILGTGGNAAGGISANAAGITGATASGAGATGVVGTVPGVGTLTSAGTLIPAAGGAAIPLSSASPSVLQSVSTWIRDTTGLNFTPNQLASGAMDIAAGLIQNSANQSANQQSANTALEAARIAADAAKFRPVGVTTRFGQSQFTKDAQGNVTGAGYTLSPELKALQDSLLGAAPGMLNQFTNSVATTAPMGTAAQRAMSLGNQYLATDPLAQAQKYYNDQQAVMATQRARDQAGMLTGEFNRGTYGLATGGTGQMGAANPRLEAMYNAQRQQDLQLAANATQGGMDYAKFGAGMVGTGGDLLKAMYGTQTASYAPFQTALGGAQTIEGLGQNALDLSINMGKIASPAQSGQLLSQGMLNALPYQQAQTQSSPWAAILGGGANMLQNWGMQPANRTSNIASAGGWNQSEADAINAARRDDLSRRAAAGEDISFGSTLRSIFGT